MRADYKTFDNSKKVLITGAAGFIGFHLSKRDVYKRQGLVIQNNFLKWIYLINGMYGI